MNSKSPCAMTCVLLVLLNPLGTHAWGQQASTRLQVLILEGDGVTNMIRSGAGRDVVVQVRDENGQPVSQAAVMFFLPNQGPGGTFPDGGLTLTTTTNSQGQAAARGIRINNQPGTMQVRVSASYGGQTANAIATQANASSGSSGAGMSFTTKLLIIAGLAGAGIVAGASVGRGGSSGSSSPASPTVTPVTTLTVGTPVVGGPQ